MAKKRGLNYWILLLFMLAGSIALFGVGGFFFAGGFMNVFLLNMLPMVVHQTVGVLLMISGVGGLVSSFIK